jgi:hypothetical protein
LGVEVVETVVDTGGGCVRLGHSVSIAAVGKGVVVKSCFTSFLLFDHHRYMDSPTVTVTTIAVNNKPT